MSWIDKVLGRRPSQPPPPAEMRVVRWPGGTMVIDLNDVSLDRATFSRVSAALAAHGTPRFRVWLLSATELRRRSKNALLMQEFLVGLHAASLGFDESGKRVPDIAVLSGNCSGVMGAVALLWSLAVPPFALGDDGSLPFIEAQSALGQWVAGPHGTPLGEDPAKATLRAVYLTRDKIEAQGVAADTSEEATRLQKLLEIATAELSFIHGVLQKTPAD